MIWFTSDLHFGHNNIINLCRSHYGFKNLEEMEQKLIDNWNARIKEKELVYVLGDFCFKGVEVTKRILDRLNGTKICVLGNHDMPAHKMLEAGFDKVFENHKIYLQSDGEKHEVYLSHYPFYPLKTYHQNKDRTVTYRETTEEDTRYLHKRILDDGRMILLHGHTHSTEQRNGRMIHVGVDAHDLKPVSSEKIIKMIKEIKNVK